MTRTPWTTGVWVVALATGVACAACGGHSTDEPRHVLSIVRGEAGEPAQATAAVLPRVDTGPSVPAHAGAGVPPFAVLAREPRLSKAPCSTCHTQPLAAMRWSGAGGRRSAHWQVDLEHAPAHVMTCTTCHTPDNLNALRTLTNSLVAFDHAYEVCAQCHSGQKADWEGGAHGKRTGGWTPPRVVFNCTECHDPHRPAFPSRWPARAGRSASDR
jgi:hypothetical protein